MTTFTFEKLEGTGNDFILVDNRDGSVSHLIANAAALCDRHFGIGADGLILVEPSEQYDIKMRIINADGSEPEMCGNGIRCFAKYVHDHKIVDGDTFTVDTLAGKIVPTLIKENGTVVAVKVDMGPPILTPAEVPVRSTTDPRCVDHPITVDATEYRYTAVSMGNPHAVIFVDDNRQLNLPELGPKWEHHQEFPERINTEFAQVITKDHANMRVWERGAAETLACGTGACATLVAGVLTDRLNRTATITLPGGDLEIAWPDDNGSVWMTGPVNTVFKGSSV